MSIIHKNAINQIIEVGQKISGKWNPFTKAVGIVKSLGRTKVKIQLTNQFTKTLGPGKCVDIYFQNTWSKGGVPINWQNTFKWKTHNPCKKGSRGGRKLKMFLLPKKTEFTEKEKLIALQYMEFIGTKNS